MKREVFSKMLEVGFFDWFIYILIMILTVSFIIAAIPIITMFVTVIGLSVTLYLGRYTYGGHYRHYEGILNDLANDATFYEQNVTRWNRFFSSTLLMPPNVRKRMLLNLYDKAIEVGKKKN